MRRKPYLKLAWSGIYKNRQLYVPYLLTCACMVMMSFIVSNLVYAPMLNGMFGGRSITEILSLGRVVVAVFALIFLFYTHSFLIRRRNREFGLYNILGMGKGDIARILLWETLLVLAASLAAGLALGVLFSKLAELVLLRFVRTDISYGITISRDALSETVVLFAGILFLTLLISAARVRLSDPLALLKSDNVGEKPPKARWILAVIGLLLLAAAYWIAVTIRDPIAAMLLFFVAVIMIIIATYLLFITGSVVLCKLLQKNKRYYYRAAHFVSVSSMRYRMKRNGAGLASICILSCMVLVMLSASGSLFFSADRITETRYPYDITACYYCPGPLSDAEALDRETRTAIQKISGGTARGLISYSGVETSGMLMPDGDLDSRTETSRDLSNEFGNRTDGEYAELLLLPLADYNALTGETRTLAADEALIWSNSAPYPYAQFSVNGLGKLRVRGTLQSVPAVLIPFTPLTSYVVVLADPNAYVTASDEPESLTSLLRFDFDLDGDLETQEAAERALAGEMGRIQQRMLTDRSAYVRTDGVAAARRDMFESYGSLFFLGILLSVLFLLAAVLIIYYKQISEGYEDAARFDIMQKVGMTKREIHRTIHSQVLTVFYAPLLLAGIHLAFALPIIAKILRIFGMFDLPLLIWTNVGCFLLFALFYALVYGQTARVYYRIVSGAGNDAQDL